MTAMGIRQPNVFDVGAYKGNVTAMYRRMFPQATVHAFEPLERKIAALRLRFKGIKRITIEKMALGSGEHDEGTLYVGGQDGEMSSLYPRPRHGRRYYHHKLSPGPTVPITTVDAYCKKHAITHINILKMDTHGAELGILKGAADKLYRQLIDLMYIEIHICPMYDKQPSLQEIMMFLESYGYTMYGMYGLMRSKKNGQLKALDAIFVSYTMRLKAVDSLPEE